MNALFALSGVTSACSAHPAKSREAAAPLNRSSTKRCSDISPMRANSRRPSSPGAPRQPGAGTHRWERGQKCFDDGVAVSAPLVDDRAVGRAVAGAAAVDAGDRGVQVPREHGRRRVRQRVGQHGRGVRPTETEALELEVTHHRRCGRHRIERAEQVVAEPGSGDLGGSHRAAWFVRLLQDEHAPASVGEAIRGDQTVRPGTDHDGVDCSRHGARLSSRSHHGLAEREVSS